MVTVKCEGSMSTKVYGARKILTVSFAVNISDVVLNAASALATGSVILTANFLQGASDLVSSGLLLLGLRKSQQPPDKLHPFGYGREIYFWTLIASLLTLFVSAGVSIYMGLQRLVIPVPIDRYWLALTVLTISFVTNGYSLLLGYRRLLGSAPGETLAAVFMQSALAETKSAFVSDLTSTLSAVLGLGSLIVYSLTGDGRLDGAGAIAIGVTITIFGFALIVGIKDLLIGRSASVETENKIRKAAKEVLGVRQVLDLRTTNTGPDRLLVNMEIHVMDGLTTDEIERVIDRVKKRVREEVQAVDYIQVELETPDY